MSARFSTARHAVLSLPSHTERSRRAQELREIEYGLILLLCFIQFATEPGEAVTQLLQKLERLRPLAAGFQSNSEMRHPQHCRGCNVRLALEAWKVSCLAATADNPSLWINTCVSLSPAF